MPDRSEPQERVTPRVSLVLCAGQDLSWAAQSIAELREYPGVLAEVVVVAAGPPPGEVPVRWVEVAPTASLDLMRAAGFEVVDENDVIWFEHRPDPIDWHQLTTLAKAGLAPLRDSVDWVAKLEQAGVDDPRRTPPRG